MLLTNFVALYRGRTVSDAELVALSAEPQLVREFFMKLLGESLDKPSDKTDRQGTLQLVPGEDSE
jgi:hypothetical protein